MVSKGSDNYQYSVLMSVYHKENAEYLRTAMDSIWNQTIPTDDFVLVCDGPLTVELDAVIEKMEKEYPDIVTQLALLLQAGMTTRQAWNRIASQYSFKRKENMIEPKPVYEAIVRMNRIFMEGESERVAYLQFLEAVPAPCYRKLMRILLGNLEKGTQGIAIRLQDESRQAFEKKILHAKKLGEEASTKMLAPLMLMLLIVMGMMMLPALMEFQI